MTDNLRALRLYLRADFQVEGLRRQALIRRDDGDG
jgi:RimJ/RimL family protein N-acetyltransferase